MNVDLIEYTTADGLRLPAMFLATPEPSQPRAVDAVLLNPGVSANFYDPVLRETAAGLTAAGYPCLAVSTRGHDIVWRDAKANRYLGSAFEHIEDCFLDFDAGLTWLADRGYQRLALIGHSLGGTKALYYAAHRPDPRLAAVVSLSGPIWSASHYLASERADDYRRNLNEAEQLIAAGKGGELFEVDFPWGPTKRTAGGYLKKYGAETYNIGEWVDRIGIPLLRVDGSLETGVVQRGVGQMMMERAVHSPHRRHITVPGGDHFYTGVLSEVPKAVAGWLDTLPPV